MTKFENWAKEGFTYALNSFTREVMEVDKKDQRIRDLEDDVNTLKADNNQLKAALLNDNNIKDQQLRAYIKDYDTMKEQRKNYADAVERQATTIVELQNRVSKLRFWLGNLVEEWNVRSEPFNSSSISHAYSNAASQVESVLDRDSEEA